MVVILLYQIIIPCGEISKSVRSELLRPRKGREGGTDPEGPQQCDMVRKQF